MMVLREKDWPMSTSLKISVLRFIVSEQKNFNDPSTFVNAIALHIRQDAPATLSLIAQLLVQECLVKGDEGLYFSTTKGADEVARYDRIVGQNI